MIEGPSKHLSWKELACKDGTPYPEDWKMTRAIALSGAFELIRNVCGDKPIKIISAFRTPSHNVKIGGARKSQHLQGRALDLKHSTLDNVEFYNKIKSISLKNTMIRGLGRYKTFVHIDIRPVKSVVYWKGDGVKDDTSS